jgi:2-aminoethylphosphonate transport system ATP-binding protein
MIAMKTLLGALLLSTVFVAGSARAASDVVTIYAADGLHDGKGSWFEVEFDALIVLKPLTLEVAAGEILALIGPSGSGKTTALRAVAGFVRPASGRIVIGAHDVTDLPPYERGLAMVVQNYALFPHMRVEENVAFGLHARGAAKSLIGERVADSLRISSG